jgi:hypothetical protein
VVTLHSRFATDAKFCNVGAMEPYILTSDTNRAVEIDDVNLPGFLAKGGDVHRGVSRTWALEQEDLARAIVAARTHGQ